ncbi:unnamed protein product [Caretta caretta]
MLRPLALRQGGSAGQAEPSGSSAECRVPRWAGGGAVPQTAPPAGLKGNMGGCCWVVNLSVDPGNRGTAARRGHPLQLHRQRQPLLKRNLADAKICALGNQGMKGSPEESRKLLVSQQSAQLS